MQNLQLISCGFESNQPNNSNLKTKLATTFVKSNPTFDWKVPWVLVKCAFSFPSGPRNMSFYLGRTGIQIEIFFWRLVFYSIKTIRNMHFNVLCQIGCDENTKSMTRQLAKIVFFVRYVKMMNQSLRFKVLLLQAPLSFRWIDPRRAPWTRPRRGRRARPGPSSRGEPWPSSSWQPPLSLQPFSCLLLLRNF